MNKVTSIHLCGVAFQLEEAGYEALRNYLAKAEQQLSANPDKAEILTDIEQAIADKFRALLSASHNVVLAAEVESVIAEMGPVTDNTGASNPTPKSGTQPKADPAGSASSTSANPQPRRLYRLKEGAMLAGVCNGLAAYLGIDVTWLRLVVAILIFFSFGTVVIAYFVAAVIVPKAETFEQRTAATGPAPTAQEFIRKAKEGYYEGFKNMPDREARRAWKRKFKSEMRAMKHNLRHEFRWGFPCPPPVAPTAATPVPPPPGFHLMMPILATLRAILIFLCWFAILSLVATGSLLGIGFPGNLPVWAGIILIVLAYKIAVAPIKALRRSYYYRLNGWPACWHPFTELWHGVLTVVILFFAVWLADQMFSSFHHALMNFPVFCHQVGDSIQEWWNQK